MNGVNYRLPLCAAFWLCTLQWSAGVVVSDRTLGTAAVSSGGGIYSIPAAAGLLKGGNLFHSFSEFNLLAGERAVFGGLNGVQNVLSRVTGGVSNINGRIECPANLVLVNPAGIVFGADATVDVAGSFSAATASHVKLSDGVQFSAAAVPGERDFLSSAPVSAFGFLSPKPAAIAFQKTRISAGAGRELFFAAGGVSLDGAVLSSSSGKVGLAAVASAGSVPAGVAALAATAAAVVPAMGGVDFKNGAKVDVSGSVGGRVVIRGGRLQMAGRSSVNAEHSGAGAGPSVDIRTTGSVAVGEGQINADVRGAGDGGEVVVQTPDLSIDGNYVGGIFADSHSGGAGAAVRLGGGRVAIKNGFVSAKSLSSGHGGSVSVTADSLSISGDAGGISTQAHGKGNGGNLEINAPTVTLEGTVYMNVDTSGSGNAGWVRVNSSDLKIREYAGIYASTSGRGSAGNITLTSSLVTVSGGYVFSISDTGATGRAGDVLVNSSVFTLSKAGELNSSSKSVGRGGNISVAAGKVTIDSASINANSAGTGPGGSVTIRTPEFLLTGYGVVSASSTGAGAGGSIEISATKLSISERTPGAGNGGGFVRAGASGTGAGGSVKLLGDDLLINGYGGVFTGTSGKGAAGTVYVSPGRVEYAAGGARVVPGAGGKLQLSNAYISSEVGHGATGAGGLIRLRTGVVVINGDLGGVSVDTDGPGKGGDVELEVERLRLDGPVYVSARSGSTGASGVIHVVGAEEVSLSDYSGIYAGSSGSGLAGNILVDAESVALRSSYIMASTSGSGDAGEVSIAASKRLAIDSRGSAGGTGISVNALSGSTGLGGRIRIKAGDVSIFGNSDGGSGVTARSETSSSAGSIVLEAASVLMDSGASVSSANTLVSGAGGGRGNAGSVRMEVSGGLSMIGGSVVTTEAGNGDAGVLTLHAGSVLELKNGSSLRASAPVGVGGDIEVTARDVIDVDRSTISAMASVQGGNVSIDPHFVFVDHGLISARAYGAGRAGNLTIECDYFFSNESRVFATGALQISSIDANIANAVAPLRGGFAPASAQLQERCAMRLGGDVSSFLVVGRGGTASDAGASSLESAVWRRGVKRR
jgi:filamentous hemagglutinin family protein